MGWPTELVLSARKTPIFPRLLRRRITVLDLGEGLGEFEWMTRRSLELVRVLCVVPPTSWGIQRPDRAKSKGL